LHSFQTIASLHLCFASWWLTRNLVAWLPCSLLSPFSSWPCSSLAGRTIPLSKRSTSSQISLLRQLPALHNAQFKSLRHESSLSHFTKVSLLDRNVLLGC
jgi:hypothetical protein